MANRYMLPLRPERVLLGHPDIKEAVVCGIEDRSEETDESTSTPKSQLLRAYIIRRGSTSLDEATVVNYAAQAAPDLPRIDGGVVFPDKIPRIAAVRKNSSSARMIAVA